MAPLTFILTGDLWGSSFLEFSSRALEPKQGKERQRISPRRGETGKESKQMLAGRGRAPRPPGQTPVPQPKPGGQGAPRAPKGSASRPCPAGRPTAPPPRRPLAAPAPRPPGSAPRRAPTLARAPPPPHGPLGPPRPGPRRRRRRQRSVTAPLLSCLRSASCQEGEALLHPGGRGRGGGLWRRRPARGDPAGEARGGEAAGQGVGGERAAPPQRPSPPAPASTFCTARRGAGAPISAVQQRVLAKDAQQSWGPVLPAARSSGANLAARPAPQPFSRGGGGGGPARSCRRGSRTRSLPGAPGTVRPASPSPPAELPTAPGPQRGSSCSRRFAHSAAPADHLPTAGAERCQLSSLPPH